MAALTLRWTATVAEVKLLREKLATSASGDGAAEAAFSEEKARLNAEALAYWSELQKSEEEAEELAAHLAAERALALAQVREEAAATQQALATQIEEARTEVQAQQEAAVGLSGRLEAETAAREVAVAWAKRATA